MSHRPEGEHGAAVPLAALVAVAASCVNIVQFVSGGVAFGLGGLIALVAPGILIALAASPRLRRMPASLLTIFAVTLAFVVLLGIAAASTPRGLDAAATAALGQVVLTLAFGAWLVRSRGAAVSPLARSRLFAPTQVATAVRATRRSAALVLAGLAMAGIGLVVARGAAVAQVYPAYVVLWSGPSTATHDPIVGVSNAWGSTLRCSLELTRRGATPLVWSIDALPDGASWEGRLPPAASGERLSWLLQLRCTDTGGAALERRLRIDPPA